MPYIEQTLTENENIISSSDFHWWHMGYPISLTLIFLILSTISEVFLLGVVFGTVFIILRYIERLTTEQVLTNKRVFLKKGLIRRDTDELLRKKIETVSIQQSILGRILNFGDLKFTGTGGIQIKFTYVPDPTIIKKNLG